MAKKHSSNNEYLKKVITVSSDTKSEYTCMCCCKETFASVEGLQLHIQEKHGKYCISILDFIFTNC